MSRFFALAFFGLSAAQLEDYLHYKHKKGEDLCLAAVSPGSGGSQFGALVLQDCSTLEASDGEDKSTVWNSKKDKKMILANADLHNQHPCVNLMNSGGNLMMSFAYSEDGNCVGGHEVSDDGYWVLENPQNDGKMGCVAYEGSGNFYLAMCTGSSSDTCKGASVQDVKCTNGWKRETLGTMV